MSRLFYVKIFRGEDSMQPSIQFHNVPCVITMPLQISVKMFYFYTAIFLLIFILRQTDSIELSLVYVMHFESNYSVVLAHGLLGTKV